MKLNEGPYIIVWLWWHSRIKASTSVNRTWQWIDHAMTENDKLHLGSHPWAIEIEEKTNSFLVWIQAYCHTIWSKMHPRARCKYIYIFCLYIYIYNHLYHILYIYVVCLNCKYHLIISQQHHFTINVRPWSNNKAPSFDFSVATCIPGQIFGSQGTWVDDRETPGKLRVS